MPYAGPLLLSGGAISPTTVGSYKYLLFTSSGLLNISGPKTANFEVAAIGGGGGAGFGGGGGGAIEYWTSISVSTTVVPSIFVTVGAGGTAVNGSVQGGNGGTTSIGTYLSALGGGGGGGFNSAGSAGGSGGGGGWIVGGGGAASGSNTNVGGSNGDKEGRPGGGATQAGNSGAEGLALTTIDSNLTSGNFATFSGMTIVSSGGGFGGYLGYGASFDGGPGGTGAGSNVANGPATTAGTAATSFGSGGAGGDLAVGGDPFYSSTAGYGGLVIVRWI
jgi:hypothetical protein